MFLICGGKSVAFWTVYSKPARDMFMLPSKSGIKCLSREKSVHIQFINKL